MHAEGRRKMSTESYEIDNVTEYNRVKKAISKKDQPNKIMRFLMNSLESYRQSRKLGWSRPWNKYDLTVFQSFKLKCKEDTNFMSLAATLLETDIAMPSSARNFINDLLADEDHLMGFVFVHEYMDDGQLYEGVTFSIGRAKEKKYRDRIDLILESPVVDENSQAFSRMRVFIDPYTGTKEPLWTCTVSDNLTSSAYQLFDLLSVASWDWAKQESRVWNHWTSNYIDYFAPRQHQLSMSHFYQEGLPESRMVTTADRAA